MFWKIYWRIAKQISQKINKWGWNMPNLRAISNIVIFIIGFHVFVHAPQILAQDVTVQQEAYATAELSYKAGDYKNALRYFRRAIDKKAPETRAYYWLGRIYHYGQGTKIDLTKASFYYEQSLQAGHEEANQIELWQELSDAGATGASYLLGLFYYEGNIVATDYDRAFEYFQIAAEKGHIRANYYIGLIHYHGLRGEKNYRLAVQSLETASHFGIVGAQIILGRIYYTGEGYIDKDSRRVLRLFTDVARKGSAEGQYYLAGLYYIGDLTARDYQKARQLFLASAMQDYVPSQYFLGQIYFYGHGVVRDYKEAVTWYLKAVEQEHTPSLLRVAQMYQLGYGVLEDKAKAFDYYVQARDLGSEEAAFQMAMMYYFGDGVPHNTAKAIELFYASASSGHIISQYNLGKLYRHGIGVQQSDVLSWVWFNIALRNGNEDAQKDVETMQARLNVNQLQEARGYLDNWFIDRVVVIH